MSNHQKRRFKTYLDKDKKSILHQINSIPKSNYKPEIKLNDVREWAKALWKEGIPEPTTFVSLDWDIPILTLKKNELI